MVGATSRVDSIRLVDLVLYKKDKTCMIARIGTKSSNLEKFDISMVGDNLLLWRRHRKKNKWQYGSFEDFLCGNVLLEKFGMKIRYGKQV